ncbi:MAG: hypothetical protein NZ839_01495, partial [Endomicrobia bacterium]|nr:hypothetical protein [Endomicrobiia bacterium]
MRKILSTKKLNFMGVVRYILYLKSPLFFCVRWGFLTLLVSQLLCFYIFANVEDNFYEKISVVGNSLGGVVYKEPQSSVLNPAVASYYERSSFSASYTYLGENTMYNSLVYYDRWFGINTAIILSQVYQDNIFIRDSILDEGIPTYMNKIFGGIYFSQYMFDLGLGGGLKTIYYDIHNTKSNISIGIDLGVTKKIFEKGSFLKNKLSIFSAVAINN